MFHDNSSEVVQFTLKFNNINTISEQCTKHYYLINNYCNYDKVLNYCKSFSLLSDKIIGEIEFEIAKYSNHSKLEKLSSKIDEHLGEISHKNRNVLGTILDNIALSNHPYLIEYTDELYPDPHLYISEIKTTGRMPQNQSIVPVYQMRTKNSRGVLFFVNIIHFPHGQYEYRSGAQHDKFYLISLFRKFGYTIYYYENLLLDTFLTLVNRLKQTHLNGMESLVFVVATHGNFYEEMEFYNGEILSVHDILFHFNNRNCSEMEGKPKIFIFPCCRGQKPDFGISQIGIPTMYCAHLETDGRSNLTPNYSDILICYATVHGFVTTRCVNNGNCYIEAFYRVLAEKACELDLETMLYMVKQLLDEICLRCNMLRRLEDPEHKDTVQTASCVKWDFNKLLYFNPGYFE